MKHLFILTAWMMVLFSVKAQNADNDRGGRIEALKIAYLTKKLDLSPSEAQKFWPVYNKYISEIKNARIDQRQNKVSELDAQDRVLNIRKKYSSEFEQAISKEKVNTFFRSEKEFGNYVQKELQERRQLRQNNQQRVP